MKQRISVGQGSLEQGSFGLGSVRLNRELWAAALMSGLVLVGCGRGDVNAEPDPARVAEKGAAPDRAGLRNPLVLPQGTLPKAETPSQAEAPEEAAPEVAQGEQEKAPGEASAAGEELAEKSAEVKAPGEASARAAHQGMQVKRLVVTTAIEQREPVKDVQFKAGSGPVYAFIELENAAEAEQGIVVTFEHKTGKKVGHVELNIPASQKRWRTWGRTQNIQLSGHWEAVVRDKEGTELARTPFEVG